MLCVMPWPMPHLKKLIPGVRYVILFQLFLFHALIIVLTRALAKLLRYKALHVSYDDVLLLASYKCCSCTMRLR